MEVINEKILLRGDDFVINNWYNINIYNIYISFIFNKVIK